MLKKLLLVVATTLILFSFVACKATTETPSTSSLNPDSLISKESLDSIRAAVSSSVDTYDCTIFVTEKDGKANIYYSMSGGMTGWTFADCVYSITTSAREEMANLEVALGQIKITFVIESPNEGSRVITWTSIDFDSGKLADLTKDPDDAYIADISVEELMELYDYAPLR